MNQWAIWNVSQQLFYSNGLIIELFSEDVAFCKACFFSMPSGALSAQVHRAVQWDDEAISKALETKQTEVRGVNGQRWSLIPETLFEEPSNRIPNGITIVYTI